MEKHQAEFTSAEDLVGRGGRLLKGRVREVAGMMSDPPKKGEEKTGETRVRIGRFNDFWGK